jgi:CheY-like chemotaxis protein
VDGRAILVIDDDEQTRALLLLGLRARGLRVLAAAGGAEAVALLRRQAADVALVPGGPEVLRRLRGLAPGLPCRLMTGDPDEPAVNAMVRAGQADALAKPFPLAGAVAKVRNMLGAGRCWPRNPPAQDRRPCVLVVDDEPAVRAVLGRLLMAQGLRVLEADGAAAAEEAVRRRRGRVRLALVDLRLPGPDGLGGLGALAALRGVEPGLPCCLVSGLVLEGQEAAYLRQGFDAVLRKPFRPADVAAVVRRLLAPPAARAAHA